MRHPVACIIFAAALFFETYALAAMTRNDEGSMEQVTTLLREEVADNADAATGYKNDGPKVIMVADTSLWKNLRGLDRGLSLYRQRAGDNSMTLDRREVGQGGRMATLKRDTMRCMVGRVYRPCWEV